GASRQANAIYDSDNIPRLGQMHGHWLMALAYFYCKQDYNRALDERDITLAMAPIDAIVYVDLSQTLTFSGRPMEALESIHKRSSSILPIPLGSTLIWQKHTTRPVKAVRLSMSWRRSISQGLGI